MEIQQLKYFAKVCEEGNITSAARKLNIAQPALSQSIKRLELDLGVELFTRKNHRVFLNHEGQALYDEILPLLDKIDILPQKLKEISDVSKKTIKIKMLAASKLITDAIISYKESFPDIYFQLSQARDNDDYDIEIDTRLIPSTDKDALVFKEEIFLALPKEWSDSELPESVKLRDYGNFDFISLDSSKPFKSLCDSFLNNADIDPPIVFSSDNPESVRNLISAGLGISFWPEFSWGEVNSDKVKLMHIEDIDCNRYIIIKSHTSSTKKEIINDFLSFLKQYIVGQ